MKLSACVGERRTMSTMDDTLAAPAASAPDGRWCMGGGLACLDVRGGWSIQADQKRTCRVKEEGWCAWT